tara:strand:+ start:711 stop:944 length:234 start_codon:yes stop_codon:yes gene_type:complete
MKKKYTKEDYANAYAQNKEGRRQLLDLRLKMEARLITIQNFLSTLDENGAPSTYELLKEFQVPDEYKHLFVPDKGIS